MRLTTLAGLPWAPFAALLAGVGFRLLRVCDFGAPDMFNLGLKYSPAPVRYATLRDARDRRSALESKIHERESRLAETANYAAPTPVATPSPSPTLRSLRIPTDLKDLEGCWVSDKGDLPLYDAVTNAFPGRAKFCDCFSDDGRGTLKYKKATGYTCDGRITPKLRNGALEIDQLHLQCSNGGFIEHLTTCRSDDRGRAFCSDRSREFPNSIISPTSRHGADGRQCD